MTHQSVTAFGLALVLAACGTTTGPGPVNRGAFASELIASSDGTPPPGPPDACWWRDDIPAVIETVTEKVLVTPERRDADGKVIEDAVYDTRVDQRMVQDRALVWFRVPCPNTIDEDFLASLQRALKARGYYPHELTGQMDDPTREAVRRFQAERGLDSNTLSLAGARELGLIAVPREAL